MSLGDLFPESLKKNFAERNVDIGKAILIEIVELQVNYPKYVIIVGNNDEEMLLAYVIINTEINPNLFPSPYLKSLHILIDKDRHDFLEYDSHINCAELKEFGKQEVIDFLVANPERAIGNIHEDLLKSVHYTIMTATTISKFQKKKFGFC
jgi:hypothetical protein